MLLLLMLLMLLLLCLLLSGPVKALTSESSWLSGGGIVAYLKGHRVTNLFELAEALDYLEVKHDEHAELRVSMTCCFALFFNLFRLTTCI